MKIEEYTAKDTTGRNRVFNKYTCDICSTEYSKQKRLAEKAKNEHYCSVKCSTLANRSNVYQKVECSHCYIEFEKKISHFSNSKSGLFFCSRACKDAAQTYLKEIQPDHYGTYTGLSPLSYRKKALALLPNECNICKYNNILALEVHHKDRNRENNDIDNLQILCANCHTILHKMGF